MRVSDSTYPQRSALGEHNSYSSPKSSAAENDATAVSKEPLEYAEVIGPEEVPASDQTGAFFVSNAFYGVRRSLSFLPPRVVDVAVNRHQLSLRRSSAFNANPQLLASVVPRSRDALRPDRASHVGRP
jgi:hypothetical protein